MSHSHPKLHKPSHLNCSKQHEDSAAELTASPSWPVSPLSPGVPRTPCDEKDIITACQDELVLISNYMYHIAKNGFTM